MCKTIVLLLMVSAAAFGGFEQTEISPRARAMGGSYVGLANDVWAIFFNAGGLATMTQSEVSFLYAPEQFGLGELAYSAGAVLIPTNLGAIGFAARRYGFELYREISGTIAYGHKISNIGIGVVLNYHTVAIEHYGSAGTFGIDIGAKVNFSTQVSWGISAKNINSPTIGVSQEPLPQIFSSGIAYHPGEDFSLTFDFQKEIGFDPSPKFGFEYWMIPQFAFRGGVAGEPTLYSGGIGVKFSAFQIDYAFSSHQNLGWTQEASLTIRWGEQQ